MSKTFNCNTCNKVFASKQNLKVHLQTVCERDEDLKITCTFCESDFSTQSALNKHLKTCKKKIEHDQNSQKATLSKELEESKTLILSLQSKISSFEKEISEKNQEIIYLKGKVDCLMTLNSK